MFEMADCFVSMLLPGVFNRSAELSARWNKNAAHKKNTRRMNTKLVFLIITSLNDVKS